jgi:hypothetical protein
MFDSANLIRLKGICAYLSDCSAFLKSEQMAFGILLQDFQSLVSERFSVTV